MLGMTELHVTPPVPNEVRELNVRSLLRNLGLFRGDVKIFLAYNRITFPPTNSCTRPTEVSVINT